MIGYGTAYQRGSFLVAGLLAGQLTVHCVRRRTLVVLTLLTAVVIVASTLTSQTRSSTHCSKMRGQSKSMFSSVA